MMGERSVRENVRISFVAEQLEALVEAHGAAPPDERAALAAETFAVAQLPRAPEVNRALQAMAARVAAVDPALTTAVRELQDAVRDRDEARRALNEAAQTAAEDRDEAEEAQIKAKLREDEARVLRLDERIQATFPRYASLVADSPLPLREAQALLRPREALLVLLVATDEIYVLLVRPDGAHLHRAAMGRSKLGARVRDIRRGLAPGPDGALAAFDVAAAHGLFTELIGPVAPGLAGVEHLLVVPSGALLSLPLQVLVTRPGAPAGGSDYRNVAWLGRDVGLSVLPSVGALRDLRRVAGRSTAPGAFIGFGDPAFAGAAGDARGLAAAEVCTSDAPLDPAALRALPRLPDSARELRELARALGADPASVVLGADASEARVKVTDLKRHRVIAFATHGLLPGELRCLPQPALALTPPPAPGRDADGLLDASEIGQLTLDADWVILSACNTAGGGRFTGESLSGLTRAFVYAGARALLASHWQVQSRAATALTTGTVGAWARDPALGRAEALRRAQAALAQAADTSHPFFWAPFSLIGDGGRPASP
jgi:CHAT domain-containing protein